MLVNAKTGVYLLTAYYIASNPDERKGLKRRISRDLGSWNVIALETLLQYLIRVQIHRLI